VRGRLGVSSGLSAECSYELTSADGGYLKLPSSLYLPVRKTDEGTLTLEDDSQRQIDISFGEQLGDANFLFTP
jgi:hypothetical protein